jgi:hypothetical protein
MNAFFHSLSPPTGNNAQRDYYTIRNDIGRAQKRMRIHNFESEFRSANPVFLLYPPPQFWKLLECEQILSLPQLIFVTTIRNNGVYPSSYTEWLDKQNIFLLLQLY